MPPKVSINDLVAHKQAQASSAPPTVQDIRSLEQAIYSVASEFAKYLDGKVTKTEVTNHLKSIGTPDALKVVDAVNQLHSTLKTHKNTDLSEVTTVMKSVLAEAKKIPKENPKFESVDYSKQFAGLTSAIKAVEKVVKEQKLIAKAPIVNVPEPKINVAPPNLVPLQGAMAEVAHAVKSLVIPENKPIDTKPLEKKLDTINKTLKDLPDKMPSGGFSGGGTGIPAFRNSAGNPDQPVINTDGSIPVSQSTPSALVSFITTVTTAGTRVQLASNSITAGVLQAPSTNAGNVYIGGSTVSATVFGSELQPGQSIGVNISNTNLIYIDSATNGDKVAFLGS